MLEIFLQILPLFSIIGLGWLITHLKIANENWNKVIGNFALWIGFPALIFSELLKTPITPDLISKSFLSNSIILFSLVTILLIIFKISNFNNSNKATYLICFMFGNVAFLGIPLISSINPLLQQEATLNAAVHLFWVFSIGLFLVEYFTSLNTNLIKIIVNLFKNPLLLAVLFGLAFNVLNLQLPSFIITPIAIIGVIVSPVVMFMIGIFIKAHPIKNFTILKGPILYSIAKLFVIPIMCIIVLNATDSSQSYFATITDFAMPVAITPFALASHYKLNKEFIYNSIIISTITSIISIPIIIEIINWY